MANEEKTICEAARRLRDLRDAMGWVTSTGYVGIAIFYSRRIGWKLLVDWHYIGDEDDKAEFFEMWADARATAREFQRAIDAGVPVLDVI